MADEQLPYKVEYSKSNRASCKVCKEKIGKDVLRLAAMVQSAQFDGKVPNWYHYLCFFTKQRPPSAADIDNFDSIRYDDQQKIIAKIESAGALPAKGKGKGKGEKGKAGEMKEFLVETAANARAGCKGCDVKITKGEVRLGKMDYTSDSARRYGPMRRWHHLECFLQLREELQYYSAAADLPGFFALPADVQDDLKDKIKPIKRKAEDTVDSTPAPKKPKKEDEKLLREQNDAIFKIRDSLKALTKPELNDLLEFNFEKDMRGTSSSELQDYLADYLVFGIPLACSVCTSGLFVFKTGSGYACKGHLTEFTRCVNVEKTPKRTKLKIPKELVDKYSFLAKWKKPQYEERLFVDRGPSIASLAVASTSQGPKLAPPTKRGKPLLGLSFTVCGNDFTVDAGEIKEKIKSLGGKVTQSVSETTAAVVTTPGTMEVEAKPIKKAEALGVQCVGEDFLQEVKEADSVAALRLIKKKAISDWGEDPEKRVSESKLYSTVHKSGKSGSGKSGSDTLKVKLKDGGAVDPDSGLSECARVLTYKNKLYNCVLSLVDIGRGTNSFYKMQVLESDTKSRYWVFRSWGRIGTTIGGTKLEEKDKFEAMSNFKSLYADKTGNEFLGPPGPKLPGKWTVLDICYGETKEMEKMVVSETTSSLPLTVQQLVALIFDVDLMKSQMMEFEIDLKKLPLGKLSGAQLSSAFKVLTEAQRLLEEEDVKNRDILLRDCSNRFYTLIPHDFGMNKVPSLDNMELIKSKIEMVESLKEIEVAYSLLQDDSNSSSENASVIEKHYSKLNTKIEPVDTTSDEFDVLQKYVKNTHASTHTNYSLKLENAFRIERKGEAKRFKPFKKLHNHKLLWHGSRLTNFVGILSQGLRIAPPEAPVTGYMFGKGIYFADMVSKSANYCSTSSTNNTGLMLLCDVALGNMYERNGAEYVTKLKSGLHSTKGCGRTFPDPDQSATLSNLGSVEVPLGQPKTDNSTQSSLLYNEFIVYDVAQIEVKYLLKMDFNYSSSW